MNHRNLYCICAHVWLWVHLLWIPQISLPCLLSAGALGSRDSSAKVRAVAHSQIPLLHMAVGVWTDVHCLKECCCVFLLYWGLRVCTLLRVTCWLLRWRCVGVGRQVSNSKQVLANSVKWEWEYSEEAQAEETEWDVRVEESAEWWKLRCLVLAAER